MLLRIVLSMIVIKRAVIIFDAAAGSIGSVGLDHGIA